MRGKLTNILWGLIFIIIGLGVAGNAFDLWDFTVFFDGWWTFIIIVPCLVAMIQNGFRVGSIIGFTIGVLLFLSYQPGLRFDVTALIVPAILIIIGLRIMFQSMFHRRPESLQNNIHVEGKSTVHGSGAEHMAFFSGNRVRVQDEFYGTSLNAVFGGLVLDLREAIIKNDVEIQATAMFGGIDIYVPNGVLVKVSSVPIFGGVSNKTNRSYEPGLPTIYLNATCMFGGIDIK